MSPDSSPLVSVIVPVWNRAGSIENTLGSLLTQSLGRFEVIVVDDGSTDSTPQLVEAIADQRVRLIRAAHQGAGGARNSGASAARSEVLAFLDSDDDVDPRWVEQLSEPLLAGRADVSVCGWTIHGPGDSIASWLPTKGDTSPDELSPRFLAGAWAVRRVLFEQAGGYDAGIGYGENSELALRLLLARPQVRVATVPDALLQVRRSRSTPPPGVQAEGARTVLARYQTDRSRIPRTWASYHTLVAVDEARRHHSARAVRHLLAALAADPRGPRRWSRVLVALIPGLAPRVWGPER